MQNFWWLKLIAVDVAFFFHVSKQRLTISNLIVSADLSFSQPFVRSGKPCPDCSYSLLWGQESPVQTAATAFCEVRKALSRLQLQPFVRSGKPCPDCSYSLLWGQESPVQTAATGVGCKPLASLREETPACVWWRRQSGNCRLGLGCVLTLISISFSMYLFLICNGCLGVKHQVTYLLTLTVT